MDVVGSVAPGFEAVRNAFVENFASRGEVGAGVCVYRGAEPVVDLVGGTTEPGGTEPYGPRAVQVLMSCGKGALAICAHLLAQRGDLDLDAPVARYWPEFAASGKDELPVRYLLSHQAGLPAADRSPTLDEVLDWTWVCALLAAATPLWQPGAEHGYHALTYGWLVGEVIARITGMSPGRFFAAEVAGPLGLDLHIGLDPAEHGRVSRLVPPSPAGPGTPAADLAARMGDPDTLAFRASFVDAALMPALVTDPRTWTAEIPGANAIGTAAALARLYAACLGEVDGIRLLTDATRTAAAVEQAHGVDTVMGYETRYALGFQLPVPFRPMSGGAAFGHYGVGGSVGFADPTRGFSFGYTANQMGPSLPADVRSVALIDAVLASL